MDEAIKLQGGRFHSIQCAIDYGLKKAAKTKQKEIGAAKRAFKSENETLPQAIKKAQVAFNKYPSCDLILLMYINNAKNVMAAQTTAQKKRPRLVRCMRTI